MSEAAQQVTDQSEGVDTSVSRDEMADRFESIINGFRAERRRRDKQKRKVFIISVVSIVFAFAIVVGAVTVLHTQAAQATYDNQAQAHLDCESRNEGRRGTKDVAYKVLNDVAMFGSADRTPEEQAAVEAFVEAEKIELESLLAQLDCDEVAPAPKGPRPSWPS